MTGKSIGNASELLSATLHEVFGERDPDARWAAITRTYSEDVRFIEPDRVVVGWRALNDRAQQLLNDSPDGVFEEASPRYFSTDTAALAWRFGPPGAPVVGGIDILTIGDGRVTAVRTLLATDPGSGGPDSPDGV